MVADGTRLEFTAEIANVKTVAAKKSMDALPAAAEEDGGE